MENQRTIVIVGGVAGGASCAARLRRLDEHARIIMLERSGYVSYANCGLPYYVGGVINDKKRLTLQTPASFKARFNVDVRVLHEVVSIDPEAQQVSVHDLKNDEIYELAYDELLLSPGARPIVPSIPGASDPCAYTVRTVEDVLALRDVIEAEKPRRAVVIGGGFIGLEMAENLMHQDIATTLIQRDSHVLPTLDLDMAHLVHNELRSQGINLQLNAEVVAIESGEEDKPSRVVLASGEAFDADLVIMSIGVAPETTLAKEAGLELGIRGAIVVDEHMHTSAPHVWAVGDGIQITNYVTSEPGLFALAGPANRQARIAADNMCGIDSAYLGATGASVIKVFSKTVASCGLSEAAAQRAGYKTGFVVLSAPNHATYYPGAESMTLKVVFDATNGVILGAQAVGESGTEKRIDVVATALRAKMTADDLAELDLCYAPPFSSAKDPVNVAGYIIQNIIDNIMPAVSWDEVFAAVESGKTAQGKVPVLLDVRTKAEFDRGHLDGAINISVDELRDNVEQLSEYRDSNSELYVYCQSALRSYVAVRMLMQMGFTCANVIGGYGFLAHALNDNGAGPCGLIA